MDVCLLLRSTLILIYHHVYHSRPSRTVSKRYYAEAARAQVERYDFGWYHLSNSFGPIVKWYYAAFALLRREFDSPWVHHFHEKV